MRSFLPKTFLALVVGIFFLLLPHAAQAATLSVSPASGAHAVGSSFTVSVNVSSTDQAMNAVSGTLNFPTDLLRATAVSKSGSILTLWVTDPSYSNTGGTVSFEGVLPNPGFQGSGAKVVSVTFKVLKQGSAQISFISTSSVLANDGSGTNIIRGTSGGIYNLTPAAAVVAPTPAPAAPTATTTVEVPVVKPLMVPTITSYSAQIAPGVPLVVKGVSSPNMSVRLSLVGTENSFSQLVGTDIFGNFTGIFDEKLVNGIYRLSGITIDSNNAKSEPSSEKLVIVVSSWYLRFFSSPLFITIASLFALLLGLLLLVKLFRERFYIFGKRERREKQEKPRIIVAPPPVPLIVPHDNVKDDLEELIRLLQGASSRRELTAEERLILTHLKEDISDF